MAQNRKLKNELQNPESEMLDRLDLLQDMELFEMVRDLGIEKKGPPVNMGPQEKAHEPKKK